MDRRRRYQSLALGSEEETPEKQETRERGEGGYGWDDFFSSFSFFSGLGCA